MILLLPGLALATGETDEITIEEGVSEIMEEVDVSSWDAWFAAQSDEMKELWDGLMPSDFLEQMVFDGGGELFSWEGITDALSKTLLGALPSAMILMMAYCGFAVLGGTVRGIQFKGELAATAQLIFLAAVGCFALAQMWTLIKDCRSTLLGLASLMEILLPTMVALLALFGAGSSAAVMQPASAVLSGTIISLIVSTVMPLAIIGGVVGIIDTVMRKERSSGMGKLCNRLCKWAVGGCSLLYLLFTTIRGAAANAADSVLLKTGKFAASSLPFVGRLVADSMDTVYGCMVLVKNAVGITGIVIGLFWVLRPVLLLLLNILALRGAAALCAPIGDEAYLKVLSTLSDMLAVLLGALIAVLMMFVVTIGLLGGIGTSA
ncbi:MAG: hypothetical protein Q4C04_05855 [Clostridia bacterium]|nr:hypothetical protein [Clostridia bacterium]